MKKITFVIMFLLLIMGIPTYSHASGYKIAVVNLQKALNNTVGGKQAKAILERMAKEKQKMIKKAEKKLAKQKAALGKLSASDMNSAKLDSYKKNVIKFRALIQKVRTDLAQKEAAYSKNILNSLTSIVKKIRKKDGYAIVLEVHSGIVDYDPSIDITNEVIKSYNNLTATKGK